MPIERIASAASSRQNLKTSPQTFSHAQSDRSVVNTGRDLGQSKRKQAGPRAAALWVEKPKSCPDAQMQAPPPARASMGPLSLAPRMAWIAETFEEKSADEIASAARWYESTGQIGSMVLLLRYAITERRMTQDARFVTMMLKAARGRPRRIISRLDELQAYNVHFDAGHDTLIVDLLLEENAIDVLARHLFFMFHKNRMLTPDSLTSLVKTCVTMPFSGRVDRLMHALADHLTCDIKAFNLGLAAAKLSSKNMTALDCLMVLAVRNRVTLHIETVATQVLSAARLNSPRLVEFWCEQVSRCGVRVSAYQAERIAAQFIAANQGKLAWRMLCAGEPHRLSITEDTIISMFEAGLQHNDHELTQAVLDWLAQGPFASLTARLKAKMQPRRAIVDSAAGGDSELSAADACFGTDAQRSAAADINPRPPQTSRLTELRDALDADRIDRML